MLDEKVAKNLDQPVSAFMRGGFARLSADQTAGEALEAIRLHQPEGRIIYFYVLDSEGRLQGVVPTRRLLLSALEKPVAEIMVREVIAVPLSATVLEACEFFVMHRLLAFPVIDADRRMVGVIDVELYTAELDDIDRSERYDELFQLIGVHLTAANQGDPLAAFRNRFPWLMCNIAGGIIAAFIAGFFEGELQRVAALAMFIPVVLAVAESISIQSLSLTLQLLRGQTPSLKNMLNKIRAEAAVGLLLGLAAGCAVAAIAWLWRGQARIIWALLGGIAGGATCAASLGVAMPIMLRLFRRDPRVAAGPIALALTDMITLLIYLHLARWLWPGT